MPLGAARITLLAKSATVTVEAEVIRKKIGVSAINDAQVDTAQSKFGGASALFDGLDDHLYLYEIGARTANEFTIEAWVRFDILPENQTVGSGSYMMFYSSGGNDYFLLKNDSGNARFSFGSRFDGTNNYFTAEWTGSTFSTNTWYHIAVTRNSSNLVQVWWDGVEADNYQTPIGHPNWTMSGQWFADTADLVIGKFTDSRGSWDGNIDEIRFSDTARYTSGFTPSTTPFTNDDDTFLLLHMNGRDGSTVFEDDNGVDRSACSVLVGNNAQIDTAQSKFGGSSAIFDGTNDTIRVIPDPNVMAHPYTGAFTIEFWFYMPTNPGAAATLPLVNRLGGGFGAREFMFLVENLNIRIAYNAYNGTDPIQNLNMNGSGAFATSTWHHIAWGYDGVNQYSVWLNGTRFNTVTTTYSNHQLTATGFQMAGYGSLTSPGNDWPGSIDEFRISTTDRYGVTNSSITVPTAPFVNDTSTAMLLHMDGTDGDQDFRDDNGHHTTGRTAVHVSPFGDVEVDTAQSKFGGSSALFDGTDDYLFIDEITLGDEWTIEGWFRFDVTGRQHELFEFRETNNAPGVYYIGTDNKLTVYDGGATKSTNTISSGTWYHIAFVSDPVGGTVKGYVDGVEWLSRAGANTINAQFCYIGQDYNVTSGTGFDGNMDEIRFSTIQRYTSGFTPSTTPFEDDENTLLLLHMDGADASTTFTDDVGGRSSVGVSAVGNAQVDTAQSKFGGASLLLDGTDDYLQAHFTDTTDVDVTTTSGARTFECWVYADTIADSLMTIMTNRTYGGSTYGWRLGMSNSDGTNGELQLVLWDAVSSADVVYSTNAISASTWHHIAYVWDGTDNHSVYIDGTRGINHTASDTAASTGNFYIGEETGNTGRDWDGNIDEVRISDTARYSGASFTVPTAPFENDANTLLLLHMDGTDGSTTFVDDNGKQSA